jgi:hypothetical protein
MALIESIEKSENTNAKPKRETENMKDILTLILLVGVISAAPLTAFAQQDSDVTSTDQEIAKVKQYREAGEQKIQDNKFTRKEIPLTGPNVKESIKQKWEKMDAYYEGDKLVRLQLYPHKGVSGRTEEFYLMNDKLVFAYIQDKGPKNEGRDMGQPGKEFYFDNDKLIKMENRSGETSVDSDQEKKMYEARLPYEITELLDILKKK